MKSKTKHQHLFVTLKQGYSLKPFKISSALDGMFILLRSNSYITSNKINSSVYTNGSRFHINTPLDTKTLGKMARMDTHQLL